jgi:hypothetical protein
MANAMKIPALAALAATLALSCSPADVADTSGVSSAIADGCAEYAYAYCTKLASCSSTVLQQRWGSTTGCESIEKTSCVNALTAPQTGATLAGREACMAALPQWDCTDFIDSQNPPPACHIATGPLANGASCAVSPQCQSSFCGLPTGSACGTCADVPQSGASCADSECPQGLNCLGTPPTCLAPAETGDSCLSTAYCTDGLTCVGFTVSPPVPGICKPSVTTSGTVCSASESNCDYYSGLACNAVSSLCETLKLYEPGQACGEVTEQESSCVGGVCTRGVCVAYVPPGGACELDGPTCTPDTSCIVSADGGTSGTCQARGASACL